LAPPVGFLAPLLAVLGSLWPALLVLPL
jgi:hypothetical protein